MTKMRENTFKYLKKWCAESEGKLYCTNCGQEVFDADYEAVEGFAIMVLLI